MRRLAVAVLVLAGCSDPPPAAAPPDKPRVIVAITIDWEGAYLSAEGLEAIEKLRARLGPAPVTHFVSAAYFTKATPDPDLLATLRESVRPDDELAVHLHGWKSIAVASKLEPRLAPSYLTGTDVLLEFDDEDIGFDLDLDTYTPTELRALVRTSRQLLEKTERPVSRSFRSGGFIATPKLLQALRDEGFTIDSSAMDARQLEAEDPMLAKRVGAIWPEVTRESGPWRIPLRGGELLEVPIAAFADYATASELTAIVEGAHARLQAAPGRDVVVVLGFHQETAGEYAKRLGEMLDAVRKPPLADDLMFTTLEHAAAIARKSLPPPKS